MRRLRVSHLRFFVPFILLAWRASLPIGDNSFLWHVRAGTLQLDLGSVLTTDVFSFTSQGEAWRTQSWLAELGYGWLENLTGGIGWVPIMKFVAMSMTVALLALVVHKVAGRRSAVTLAGLLLLVWQAAPFGIARPALLGFVLLAAVVAFSQLEKRPLWLLPLLFWFWASVHGMFVVGLGYLFLDAMRRRSRRQVVAVAISGVATAFTAHGLGAWWILLQFGRSRGALDLIREWLPPDFSNPFLLPLLIVILGIMVAGTLGRLAPDDLWILIPFVAFGLLAERNVWPAVMVLVPLAAGGVDGQRCQRQDRTGFFGLQHDVAEEDMADDFAVFDGNQRQLRNKILGRTNEVDQKRLARLAEGGIGYLPDHVNVGGSFSADDHGFTVASR